MRDCAACRASIRDIGLMTHFANSDVFDDAQTPAQIARFAKRQRICRGERSLSNSAGMLGWPDARGDWVRAGGVLYGMSVVAGKSGCRFRLPPGDDVVARA